MCVCEREREREREKERERERFVRMAPRTNFLVQDFLMWMKKNESSLLKM